MSRPATDWTGYQYSYLRIIGRGKSKDAHGRTRWVAKCVCGKQWEVDIRDIRKREKQGLPYSCGCKKRELMSQARSTHGMSQHPAYAVWHSLVQRCTNPSAQAWHNYGARGITVCDRWLHSFENFWEDMGASYRPHEGLELDRIDNDMGYSPGNCHWVSRSANARNRRDARKVQYKGHYIPLKELSEITSIGYTTLLYRLDHGCPLEHLTDTPDPTNRFTTF